MTKISTLKLYRTREEDGSLRAKPLPAKSRRRETLICGRTSFDVWVHEGQFINKKKMCARLLRKEKEYKQKEYDNKRS